MANFKLDRFKYTWRGQWSTATDYIRDDVVSYGGSSFVCISAHTADTLFSTDLNNQDQTNNVPAPRWVKMTDGYAWRDSWESGSTYDPGDIVSYSGVLYLCVESNIASSTFDDDLTKWAVYSSQIKWHDEWTTGQRYGINDVVRYNGVVYKCIEGHTSSTSITDNQLSWEVLFDGIEFKSDWEVDNTYRVGDVVKFGGSLYRCIRENSPIDDSAINFDQDFWQLLAPGYEFRGEWDESTTYRAGDVVKHGGWLFYSLTDNIDDNPATNLYQLEKRTDPIVWEIVSKGIRFRGDWSADESYKTGDMIRRSGQVYVALLDNSITADGSSLDYLDDSNWELIVPGQSYQAQWQEEQFYSVGDVVFFAGTAWICKLAHTSDFTTFPAADTPSAGTGFVYWDVLILAGSESGLVNRGDLLTFNLDQSFYGDDSSFGVTNVPVGVNGQLVTINNNDSVIYKNYGEINRVFYVAEDGVDDAEDLQRGVSQFKPWRTVRFACEQADDNFVGTTTVRVRTGRYAEILPIIIPARTAVVGDELRSTTVTAAGPIDNLALDSTYTIAVLTRISQLIQAVIAGIDLSPPKTPSNLEDPVRVTETVTVSFDPPQFDTETFEEIFETVEQPIETDPQAAVDIQQLIMDIQNYIDFYINDEGTAPELVGTNTAVTDQGYLNAAIVLEENKEFLAAEAVAFMQQEFPAYQFDSALCKRDVHRYIESWIYDITFTGNYKSLLAARYYRNAVLGSQTEDMFYLRDSTGLRNLTVSGLNGELGDFVTGRPYKLPTAGAYCSLDPGWGPDDDRTWINTRSPYVQNVTTLGRGAVGQKIDGALHNGGNKSIVSNDFTQVIDDGIGAWVTNNGRAELVSVFSYYAHVGYLATNGGIIRGTNGNNSYGTFGSLADGNDGTEIPQTGTVNNRNQQATASAFAGDFTDEIQILEWDNLGQEYSQASATIVGSGANASVVFEDFRDDAVYTVAIRDSSDGIAQNIGGGGYVRVQNNAQLNETPGASATTITLSTNDNNTEDTYLGTRIVITGGPGTGQYGYITAFNEGTKLVTVARESDNQPGWDHVIPGKPLTDLFTSSTAYRIEPRIIFSDPGFTASEENIGVSTNWGAVVYGETTELYTEVLGSVGTGEIDNQDGLLIPLAASFDIEKRGRTYFVSINEAGVGYAVGDEITIPGTEIGGSTPYNDLSITVTEVTDDSTNSIVNFAFEGIGASGKFLAVTENGTAGLYSLDGESWPDGFSMPSTGDWTNLAAGNNRFVAIKSSGTDAAYSLNGIDWTAVSMPENRTWKSVIYGGNRFYAIASDQNSAAYSTDGESWTSATLPTVADPLVTEWADITYGAGKYVVIANGQNVVAYSSNGTTWSTAVIDEGTPIDWISVAYGNNRYVAVATDGTVAYSFDADEWIVINPVSLTSLTWQSIDYAQGVFFVAGTDNGSATTQAYTTPDGITWTQRTLASSAVWKDIAFGNPYTEQFDSSIGKNTPMWVAISNANIVNKVTTGARALGRAEVNAGIISRIRIWNPGSGYTNNQPTVDAVSPASTSPALLLPRTADGVLSEPSWLNRGIGYRTATTRVTITGNGFADVIPTGKFLTIDNLERLPGPGAQIFFENNPIRYTIVTIEPATGSILNGDNAAFIRVSPELRIRDFVEHGTAITIRELYSQIRITGHDFLDIGTGNFQSTNYPELYTGVFFSAPENEVEEQDGGRVFYTATDQSGNFRTGELFAVEQATGIVTISADFFDLSGLEDLRLGGIRVGGTGAVIREFSTDPSFTEDSNNIVPTQRAIASFLASRLTLGGSEIATFQLQAGQIFLGGPDRIENALGLKIVIPVMANFQGSNSGVSGSMIAQNMFFRSFGD